jgi:trk system potassium uptake protein TrkA
VHVVILGCGRVGSALAHTLEERGHSVAVIDQDEAAFRRLDSNFAGRTITGMGFDRDTLIEAGIEQAGAFAAVSSGDNSNIIAARVARETFAVETVVARIYDPKRAEVYERLGIPTVATVRWTADQMVARLLPVLEQEWTDSSGAIVLAGLPVHPGWFGTSVHKIEEEVGVRVVCLQRLGNGILPDRKTVLQDGDALHAAVLRDRLDEVGDLLAASPKELA